MTIINPLKVLAASVVVAGSLATASVAFAVDEYNVSTGTTVSGSGVALRGMRRW